MSDELHDAPIIRETYIRFSTGYFSTTPPIFLILLGCTPGHLRLSGRRIRGHLDQVMGLL